MQDMYCNQKSPTQGPLFDGALNNNTLVTCITILSIMKQSIGNVNLNRIGTKTVEHHFYLLRIKSR